VSIVELNLLVSGIVASFLPKGSVSLLYYGSRFMNIPLGIFAVALTSVLLPHFSRVVLYAPRRLNFYILETAKLVSWVVVPFILIMMFLSKPLFEMILFAKKGTPAQVTEASLILIIYLVGLLFFCLNKVLLSVFYSMKDTWSTTKTAAISAVSNLVGDIVGMYVWGTYGIAASAALAGMVMTFMCFYFLHTRHGFTFYSGNYFNFLGRYVVQLLFGSLLFVVGYYTAHMYAPQMWWLAWVEHWIGFWVFACTWALVVMGCLYLTRKFFKLNVYFLNR
jgi:putative peptidoglycan lipid II flippase